MTGNKARPAARPAAPGRRPRGDRGFTLMELLVVLGIMSMVVTAASDIFLLTSRSQRKVFGLERTQADARFTMEALAREVRTGRIDYGYYAARTSPAGMGRPDGELALLDADGAPLRFSVSGAGDAACADAASSPCLLVTTGSGTDAVSSPLTPRGVAVRNLRFYVSPSSDPDVFDPSTGAYASDEQPRVTVVMVLESVSNKAEERSTVSLQTTVASRRYRR